MAPRNKAWRSSRRIPASGTALSCSKFIFEPDFGGPGGRVVLRDLFKTGDAAHLPADHFTPSGTAADSQMAKTIVGLVSWRGCFGRYAEAGLSACDRGNVVLGQMRSGSLRFAAAGGDRSRLRPGEDRNSAGRNSAGGFSVSRTQHSGRRPMAVAASGSAD